MMVLGLAISAVLVACNAPQNPTPQTTITTSAETTASAAASSSSNASSAPTTPAIDYSVENAVNTEVTFGEEPFLINGTLSIPENAVGKVPAVIIVGGSGPTDRDGTIGRYKAYKEYAQALVKNGIAVLRFDKRTLTHSQQMFMFHDLLRDFTLNDEYVYDTIAGLEFLASHAQIDASQIYLMGHSHGANVAPMIAAQYKDSLAGIIMLAPNYSPIHKLMLTQIEFIANRDGVIDANEALHIAQAKELRDYIDSPDFGINFDPNKALGIYPKYWNEIKNYDPIETILTQLDRTKFLILHGSKDFQVPQNEADVFDSRLSSMKNVRLVFIHNANHIFHIVDGQMGPENYMEENELSTELIDYIVKFIKRWN